tara:strand:+ start:155 stop:466 length:312 start_codon:yes stop_codon:yes gene_type:complete
MDTSTYLSVTDTAKLMRKSLKKAFPLVKFSVRSHLYAGGASIDVSYSDPSLPTSDVDAVTSPFQACDFIGIDDSTDWREPTMVDGKLVRFGSHYVFVRNYSED